VLGKHHGDDLPKKRVEPLCFGDLAEKRELLIITVLGDRLLDEQELARGEIEFRKSRSSSFPSDRE